MATYDWPVSIRLASIEWGVVKAGITFQGPYNGTTQAVGFSADRWTATVAIPARTRRASGEAEAFLEMLVGGVNQVRLWHMARPQPIGTMRGSPTLATAVVRGANLLTLNTGVAGVTLVAGDYFKLANQVFKALFTVVANGSGVLIVQTTSTVRAPIAAGTPVVWDRPTSTFIAPTLNLSSAHTAVAAGLVLDMQEYF